jgi:transcription termination factor Rho
VAANALEQSVLESKDKAQLVAIAAALGMKPAARATKATLIDQILQKTGVAPAPASANGNGSVAPVRGAEPTSAPSTARAERTDAAPPDAAEPALREPVAPPPPVDEPKAEWELAVGDDADSGETRQAPAPGAFQPDATGTDAGTAATTPAPRAERRPSPGGQGQGGQGQSGQGQGGNQQSRQNDQQGDGDARRKRRRRRKGGRGADGPQGEDAVLLEEADGELAEAPISNEPVQIDGYLDLRDEGYGFLRVNNFLASKTDAYIPVKLTRQYGLRKGDRVVGMSRPAGRNEKNPPLLDVLSVNGRPPDEARKRPRFEDLTALFPDERLRMEDPSDPGNMTARIIDLVCPIGKGQRGIIVSPPKAGKTTVMKTIVSSIEKNNPECKVIVLLIDERPEEVTDMRRTVKGEVISSTFDKPSDQHTQIAEMAIEKAKRLVEYGEDVVVVLDGITRLARAYNLAAPASGRILSGGIDAGALYPPKRFFGAARNVEEGGSLTILATALVETNSRMDEAVFEEFKGTGNMELRLDRRLAERRIYPAIDVDASSTRHEELLFDRKQLQMVWKLRRVLSGLAADGNAAPGLELLVDRLKTFRTNDEFLTEIAKQPGM